MSPGAPVRFLGAVALTWVGVRAAMLWPGGLSLPDLSLATPLPDAQAATIPLRPKLTVALPPAARPALSVALPPPVPVAESRASRPGTAVAAQLISATGYGGPPALAGLRYPVPEMRGRPAVWRETPMRRALPQSRWTFASWAIARPGGGRESLVSGGQLGGSQAGVRASFALNGQGTLAVAGRLSSPFAGRGREAALGLDWQPVASVPVKLMVEQRFALDRGGRSAPALGLAGGLGGVPLPAEFSLDAYAQAGVVGFRDRMGYVDGAVRMERPVWRSGGMSLGLGVGAWGAAQPGVARVDVGPQAVLRVPTGGTTLRIGLDWRQRIAGNARPGSGPALSLGADF